MSSFDVAGFREELESCRSPLYLFHDDPDGLASFLMLKKVKDGVGVPIKSKPIITVQFANKVVEVEADKVFVLDVAMMEEEFVDEVKVPIVWLDHHEPVKMAGSLKKVKYFNPQLKGKNIPTPALCYEAFPVELKSKGLWLAGLGSFAEWFVPEFLDEFKKDFPELLPSKWKTPGDVIYNSKLGKLIELFSFALKGETSAVKKNIKLLSDIDGPDELLAGVSKSATTLWKHHSMIRKEYDLLLSRAVRGAGDGVLFVFKYENAKHSLTKDLANELSYQFPGRIIVLARRQSGEFRCSFRCQNRDVRALVEQALKGLHGYSGGHEVAAGGAVREDDFDEFLKRLEELARDKTAE